MVLTCGQAVSTGDGNLGPWLEEKRSFWLMAPGKQTGLMLKQQKELFMTDFHVSQRRP